MQNTLLRLLPYTDGEWELHGADDHFAKMMFNLEGRIGLSKVCYDDNRRIRIVEGFLKPYENFVIRANRRKETAEIESTFQDRQVNLWADYITAEKAS